MTCPQCKTHGLISKVYQSTTIGYFGNRSTTFRCTNGHHWVEKPKEKPAPTGGFK